MTIPTDALIQQLKLRKHPEGGYYVETDRQSAEVPSPFVHDEPRSLSTSIYYLLTADSPSGVIHMNKSVTYHVLHQGRAEYTIIRPGTPPRIEKKVIGTDVQAGESRQLVVETGVWKMSRLLPEDLKDDSRAAMGCLITEVVVPGFHWEDHTYLRVEGLKGLIGGLEGEAARLAEDLFTYLKST